MANTYTGMSIYSHGVKIKDVDYQRKQYTIHFLTQTMQMFDYENLPDTIPKRELEKLLQQNGWACIAPCKGKLYAFNGGLGGEQNEYYLPTICTVNNPALNFNKELVIGKDCVIIKNDDFYNGLLPLFSKYAQMLATNDLTMYNVDILARIQAIILAGDNKAKKEAEKYLEGVLAGNLGFINSNSFADNLQVAPYNGNIAQNLQNLLEFGQYLKASCMNDIGLNAQWNSKKEYVGDSENQMNGDALLPFADNMYECRKNGWDEVNELFAEYLENGPVEVHYGSSWDDVQVRESEEVLMDNDGIDTGDEEEMVSEVLEEATKEEVSEEQPEEEPVKEESEEEKEEEEEEDKKNETN